MPRLIYNREPIFVEQRRYGFFSFLFDVIMTFLTAGVWLIWIFVREMRRR